MPPVLMPLRTNDVSTQVRVYSSHCISHRIRSRLIVPPALTTMALYHSSRGCLGPTSDSRSGGPATISSQAYAYYMQNVPFCIFVPTAHRDLPLIPPAFLFGYSNGFINCKFLNDMLNKPSEK